MNLHAQDDKEVSSSILKFRLNKIMSIIMTVTSILLVEGSNIGWTYFLATVKPRYSKNGEESCLTHIRYRYAYRRRSIGQLIFIFLKKNYRYVLDTANLYSDTDTSFLLNHMLCFFCSSPFNTFFSSLFFSLNGKELFVFKLFVFNLN